jgi:hypothetical protein
MRKRNKHMHQKFFSVAIKNNKLKNKFFLQTFQIIKSDFLNERCVVIMAFSPRQLLSLQQRKKAKKK